MPHGIESKLFREITMSLVARSVGVGLDSNDPLSDSLALASAPPPSQAKRLKDPNNHGIFLGLQNSDGSYKYLRGFDGPI